jgi:hypothetical protein
VLWEWTVDWGIWIVLAAGLYFFGIPLLILKIFRVEAMPAVQRVDPEEVPLPPVVQEHMDLVGATLRDHGFEERGTLLLPSTTPNTIATLRLYVNPKDRVSALANSVFVSAKSVGDSKMSHQQYVEFTTRQQSGETFNTHNSQTASSFPPAPQTLTVRVPWINDIGQVYKIHQAVSAARGGSARKLLRLDENFRGDEIAYIQDCMREELTHGAGAGYLRLALDGTHYRATIRGAYLMTWKQLAPIKQVLAKIGRLRTERLLAEVGAA